MKQHNVFSIYTYSITERKIRYFIDQIPVFINYRYVQALRSILQNCVVRDSVERTMTSLRYLVGSRNIQCPDSIFEEGEGLLEIV